MKKEIMTGLIAIMMATGVLAASPNDIVYTNNVIINKTSNYGAFGVKFDAQRQGSSLTQNTLSLSDYDGKGWMYLRGGNPDYGYSGNDLFIYTGSGVGNNAPYQLWLDGQIHLMHGLYYKNPGFLKTVGTNGSVVVDNTQYAPLELTDALNAKQEIFAQNIADLQSKTLSCDARLGATENSVTTLQTQLSTDETYISALENKLAQDEATISNLVNKVNALDAQLNPVKPIKITPKPPIYRK